jgi:general transcription factor 3C polypeptide 2
MAPGKGTVWSLTGSSRPGMVVAVSTSMDFIAGVFPDMTWNPKNIRKPAVRRFPI